MKKRNFGIAAKPGYAAYLALRMRYGGHFSTVATHSQRIKHAISYWKATFGVDDLAQIRQKHVQSYGQYLKGLLMDGDLSPKYAKNLASSLNVVMNTVCRQRRVWLQPAEISGVLSTVRQEAPLGAIDGSVIGQIELELREAGREHAFVVLGLAAHGGLRLRETALIDARAANDQLRKHGHINVTRGTKGGRGCFVDRWVPTHPKLEAALRRAAEIQGEHANIIPSGQALISFMQAMEAQLLPRLRSAQLGTIHDQRAVFACRRYSDLTGYPAPVVAGGRVAPDELDTAARERIAHELGHGRTDVTSAYLGGRR